MLHRFGHPEENFCLMIEKSIETRAGQCVREHLIHAS